MTTTSTVYVARNRLQHQASLLWALMLSGAEKLCYHLFDRPGGRTILSSLATRRLRRETEEDVSVFYDGLWVYRIGKDFLPMAHGFTKLHGSTLGPTLRNALEASREFWFHVYKPTETDVILDIGAGRGIDTLLFSRSVGSRGLVLSIEAHPTTFMALMRLCRWNSLDNVRARQCAISGSAGKLYISNGADDQGNSVSTAPGASTFAVNGVTLDQVCREAGITKVDFLKMNIEGAERLAIQGMAETIRKTRHICVACHDFLAASAPKMKTKREVVEFLKVNGFEIIDRQDDQRAYVRDHIHGKRPEGIVRF